MLEGFTVGPWALVDVHAPIVGLLKPAYVAQVRRPNKAARLHPEELPDLPPEHELLHQPHGCATDKHMEEADKTHWKWLVRSHMATSAF